MASAALPWLKSSVARSKCQCLGFQEVVQMGKAQSYSCVSSKFQSFRARTTIAYKSGHIICHVHPTEVLWHHFLHMNLLGFSANVCQWNSLKMQTLNVTKEAFGGLCPWVPSLWLCHRTQESSMRKGIRFLPRWLDFTGCGLFFTELSQSGRLLITTRVLFYCTTETASAKAFWRSMTVTEQI